MYYISKTYYVLLLLHLIIIKCSFSKIYFEAWGPGLKADLVTMPARYFFIKIMNATDSCVLYENPVNIQIKGINEHKKPCHIWTNLLTSKDCLHIVRYKVYETCHDLTIIITHNDKHVAQSPYLINNKIFAEDCVCPVKDLNKWLNDWECGEVPQQIINDLQMFMNIDFLELGKMIIEKYGNNPRAISLCRYVIKDNQIYRKCFGEYVGFKMFMDNILLSLTRKVVLPDLEFFVNLGDWPLVHKNDDIWPMFSWCGSTESYDIVMPTYDITESTLENMGRVTLDMLSVQGNVREIWENRIEKVFWRGRDSSRERLHLIDISRNHPELFNSSLTNFFFFRSEEQKYGPKADHTSFFNFFDYKYQLNLDGTVAAYRLPYLLAGGSLVFKQDSKYYEHFYNKLIPNVHYVPIKKDLSDLVEKLKWAIENDDQAKRIAQTGKEFAIKNLMPKDIFCYHVFLLNEFSKKIISKVEVADDMEIVKNSDNNDCCKRNIKDEL